MNRRILVTLLATFIAAGCAGRTETQQGSALPTTNAVSPTETTTTPPPSSQGPITKRLGDLAGAGCPDSSFENCAIVFSITKITDCTGSGYAGDPPPAGTTRKLAWIEIQTGPTYTSTDLPSYLLTQFSATNSAGVTTGGDLNPSTFWDCAPDHESIGFGDENWLPNKKYAGAIEIYLPNDAVKIANGDGFWEWVLQ